MGSGDNRNKFKEAVMGDGGIWQIEKKGAFRGKEVC